MDEKVGKAKRGIPSKKEDFNSWYPFIVEAADLVDKRYPIKGMDVWRPYGWKAMRLIDAITHREMEFTGHEEVRFPLLIPANLLQQENRLVALLKRAREEGVDPSELRLDEDEAGFEKEVYWVSNAGESELEIPMFLRPTSETAMYTMFPLWIRSHADLPLKIYQIVNTFRYETKQTRSFIRVREIHFFEAHTAHIDEAGATRQIGEDLEIVNRIMHDLCLPVIMARRPVWDTFPGAWYTIGIDVVMPNGRTLQVASCHHYRDQWAKEFGITYEDEKAEQKYCHQTTYGMSERLLGAVVGVHGDDRGLIMPPAIAPIQVVIVPVTKKDGADEIIAACNELHTTLSTAGIRVKIDGRDMRPARKYYDWEIKGVPLRLELGPRDLADGSAIAARRGGGKKSLVISNIVTLVNQELSEIADWLRNRAAAQHSDIIKEIPRISKDENGDWSLDAEIDEASIYEIAFDGSDAEAEAIELLTGLSFLGDATEEYPEEQYCCISGKPTKRRVLLSKSY
jgi:prolyl-tRNA synthetase